MGGRGPHQKSELSVEDPDGGQGVHIRRVCFQARIQMGNRGSEPTPWKITSYLGYYRE